MAGLLRDIERHIKTKRVTATRFGIDAVKDPKFVFDLREGRAVRAKTERRVRDYMVANG